MTFNRLCGFTVAIAIVLSAACGSPAAPTGSGGPPSSSTAAIALAEPTSVAWSAPAAGGTCAAGSVSDYVWTDTINETAGVQVTLSSLVVTIDGTPGAPVSVSKTVPAKGQATAARELCFTTTAAHSVTSQYIGTDANGHQVTTSSTIALSAKPAPAISPAETSQLASAIATAGGPILNSAIGFVFGLSGAGTSTFDTTQPCPAGGSARGTGPVTITIDPTGVTGSIAMDTSLVYSHCTVGSVVLDGGPLDIKGQMNVVVSVIQNPIKFTINGTQTFVVDGVTGTAAFACTNALTVDQNALTAVSLVASGNASLQYPTGQNPTTVPCQTFADAFGFGH